MKPIWIALAAIGPVVGLRPLPEVHGTLNHDAMRLRSLLDEMDERYPSLGNQLDVRARPGSGKSTPPSIAIHVVCSKRVDLSYTAVSIKVTDQQLKSITFAQTLGLNKRIKDLVKACTKAITGKEPQDPTQQHPGTTWTIVYNQRNKARPSECPPDRKLSRCKGLRQNGWTFQLWIGKSQSQSSAQPAPAALEAVVKTEPLDQALAEAPAALVVEAGPPQQAPAAAPGAVVKADPPQQAPASPAVVKKQYRLGTRPLTVHIEFFCPGIPLEADAQTVFDFVMFPADYNYVGFQEILWYDPVLKQQIRTCEEKQNIKLKPTRSMKKGHGIEWTAKYKDAQGTLVTVRAVDRLRNQAKYLLREKCSFELYVEKQ